MAGVLCALPEGFEVAVRPERRKVKDLTPDFERRGDQDLQLGKLEQSIATTGWQVQRPAPIVLEDGTVLNGSRRIKAAQNVDPEMEIPVLVCVTDDPAVIFLLRTV